jgi:hypothetical protein
VCQGDLHGSPPAKHCDQGVECNYDSWRQRGWCRMELWVNFLSRNFRTALVISGRPKLSVMDFVSTKLFFMNRAMAAVGCGEFSCCRLGHAVGKRQCDKVICMEVLKVMFLIRVLALRMEGQWMSCVMLRCVETCIDAGSPEEPYELIPTCKGSTPERRLQAFKASCQNQEPEKVTMLHEAVMSGDATIVRMLLAEGHCCDTLTFMGQTTLFLGAACGSAESLRALMEHPTCTEGTMNRGTPNNITPLERAARAGRVKQTVGRVSCIGGADA